MKAAASHRKVEAELAALADAERARNLSRFFKTGTGEYGEGDRFLGITVPLQRKVALRHVGLPLTGIARLLRSPIHEHRFTALEILVAQYHMASGARREKLVTFYLAHTKYINNWDLVDTSAPYLVGEHLKTRPRDLLDRLAASENLWERRIAIISTLALIKAGEVGDTLRIAKRLLGDEHDLIHKAVGWALREVGKVSGTDLLNFLSKHYAAMPRTALLYAIERFPPRERRRLLAGDFGQG